MASKTFTCTKDAVMGKQFSGGTFSGWNGLDNHLQVGATSSYKWRSVVYFPVNFSGMVSITSATLHLVTYATTGTHQAQISAPSSLKVARMTSDWGEGSTNPGEGNLTGTLTWDWDNRHDKWSTSGTNTKNITQGASGSEETIDVTDIVTAWFNGSNNYGIILINNTSESNNDYAMLFYSSESSGNKPYLVVNYTTNTTPLAPGQAGPADNQVTSLTPTFTGWQNDSDAGDKISAIQLQVIRYSDSALMWDSGVAAQAGNSTSFSITYGAVGTAQSLVGNTEYQWRVKTADLQGAWSPFSGYWMFKANSAPNTPSVSLSASPLTDTTPDITITHSDPDPGDDKMYGYQVIVEQETSAGSGSWTTAWDSGQIDTSGSTATTKVVTSGTLSWGGSFQVKARTKDSNSVWSGYSSPVPFTTWAAQAPTSLNPSGNESVGVTPTISGTRVSTTDSITSYEIIVYSDDLLTTMWSSGTLTSGIVGGASFSVTYAGSALSSGLYYQWKARITSTVGGTSSYSALQRFVVNDASVPTFSAPATPATSLTPTITFARAATYNRVQYELYPETSTTTNLGSSLYASGTLSGGITGSGPYTWSGTYGGSPALSWNTTYKIRARVSADAGSTWSNWSGLFTFTTDAAGAPTLTSVAGTSYPTYPWTTDATPDFVITRAGTETIYKAQYRVWNAAHTVMIWDSTMQGSYGGSTTATLTYSGPTLTPGTTYTWDAAYTRTSLTGPSGPFSTPAEFRLNGLPNTPTSLVPTPGYVYADTVIQAGAYYLPTFSAEFSDPDVATLGDTPNTWEIVTESWNGSTWTSHSTKTITSSLVVGQNTYVWQNTDMAFATLTDYRWKTRFKDSKLEWGNYSGVQQFRISITPNGTISTPSDGSTVTTVNPTVTWSYSGGTQSSYGISIDRVTVDGAVEANVFNLTPPKVSAGTSYTIPAGYMRAGKYYKITLTVYNTDGLVDPTPSVVQVLALPDPPNPITGLSATTDPDRSLVQLNWDTVSLKAGHTFVRYNIYRRLSGSGDAEWGYVASVDSIGTSQYNDWWAGHGINYQYRVTNCTSKSGIDIELESPDDPDGGSFCEMNLDTDVWMVIGPDRSDDQIAELPVNGEGHNRPVQQESFETLGSNRKVIITGFVLGNEGSIQMTWQNVEITHPLDIQSTINETVWGRRIVDYMTQIKTGPWTLKSPFGDVWDVVFGAPEYEWLGGGHLNVSVDWIETGQTSGATL
jgi:hypothetical protein